MVVILRYMAVLVSLWLILHFAVVVAEKEGASVAKIGCNQTCGDVVIPYPFGMGKSSCFLDEWFEISCVNNSTPFLKKPHLQVLIISLPYSFGLTPKLFSDQGDDTPLFYGYQSGTILVNHPIVTNSGCRTHGAETRLRDVVNLTGSTFYYSTDNTLTVVGCDYVVGMRNVEPRLFSCRTAECGAVVDSRNRCNDAFSYSNIKVLDLTFEETGRGAEKCAFAYMAPTSMLDPTLWSENSSTTALRDFGYYAPTVLEWSVYSDPELFPEQDGENTSFCQSDYYYGEPHVQCYCQTGFEGNPYLPHGCKDINECERPETNSCPSTCVNRKGGYRCKLSLTMLIIIGISSSFGFLILITSMWWLCKVCKKRTELRRKKQFFKQNGGVLLQQQLTSRRSRSNIETTKVLTSEELEMATDHFNPDRVLGRGGQGTVYKGTLSDGRVVAIKKSKIENEPDVLQQFINEVVILSQMNHRNVVKLLGCCLETDIPMLVYEFVPNGTLSHYLHDKDELAISWKMRLRIAIDVASALSYLHSTASVQIYHRDIKSTNILLDCNYRAKVSDFGTSRSVALDQTHLSTLVKGTFGYFDPEYFTSSQFTDKSDVYSFGVVLLELLTRQKPVCTRRQEEHRSLVAYFITALEENRLFDIVDASILEEEETREEVIAVANLARKCLNSYGRNRPTMKEVFMSLERVGEMSLMPQEHDEEVEFDIGSFEDDGLDSPFRFTADDDHPLLAITRV